MSGPASRRPKAVLVAADVLSREPPGPMGDADCLSRGGLRSEGLSAFLTRRLFRYHSVDILAGAGGDMRKPAFVLAAARAMTFGAITLSDPEGVRTRVGTGTVFLALLGAMVEALAAPLVLLYARACVSSLMHRRPVVPGARTAVDPGPGRGLFVALSAGQPPAFGGAVSHFRGVVEGARAAGIEPAVLTDLLSDGPAGVAFHRPSPVRWLCNVDDGPAVIAGLIRPADRYDDAVTGGVDFVYERLSAYSTLGLRMAKRRRVPFVLEYNGSERWMAENWGGGVRWPAIVTAVERANLRQAALVSVVSEALADVAERNGAAPDRIVVIPNGVNPERFHPSAEPFRDGPLAPVAGCVTVGFAGTFGPWHGTTVLLEAFCRVIGDDPSRGDRLRLLLIGSGPLIGEVEDRIGSLPPDTAILSGDVLPEDMPRALAACDILVSPQLPTDDAGGFFGDPIKLYEYMAMGKAVIASNIGRIPRVLENDVTGLLTPPGDVGALAEAISLLSKDQPLRARLGAAARRHAVEECTWRRRGEQLAAALGKQEC